MESISQMKVVVRAVSWKAEAIEEMNLSRNSGLGVEVVVVVVGGSGRVGRVAGILEWL
jgi:hypothetical protein